MRIALTANTDWYLYNFRLDLSQVLRGLLARAADAYGALGADRATSACQPPRSGGSVSRSPRNGPSGVQP